MEDTHSIEIFVNPKKTAEYIQLNFDIVPTNENRIKKIKNILSKIRRN